MVAQVTSKQIHSALKYTALVGINALYACVSVFTKYASEQIVLSARYILAFVGAVGVMGVYAVLWQQVLRRIDLSTAYMFKGTSLVFVIFLASCLFGEPVTWQNIVGACIIIVGIVLYAKE